MGKSSEPSGEQTVTNITELPPWLDTALEGAASQAQNLYATDSIPYYPGATTVPYSPQTLSGLGSAEAIAAAGGPAGTQSALETYGGLVSGYGTRGGEGVDALTGIATADPRLGVGSGLDQSSFSGGSGQLGLTSGGYRLPGETGQSTLAATAAGDYLYGSPGFDAAYDAAMRDITPTIQSTFENSGRTNSGLAQEAIGQAASDTFAGLYDEERNRQEAAANSLQSGYLTERGLQDAASGALTGYYDAGLQRQADAASGLAGLYDAGQQRTVEGLALAPSMTELAYDPSQRMLNVGGAYEAQDQQDLNAAMDRYAYDSSANARLYDQYLSRLQGIAPYGGQVGSTTSPIYSNTGANVLGGAATGAGIGQAIGTGLSISNPWLVPLGAAGGGLLGGLWG